MGELKRGVTAPGLNGMNMRPCQALPSLCEALPQLVADKHWESNQVSTRPSRASLTVRILRYEIEKGLRAKVQTYPQLPSRSFSLKNQLSHQQVQKKHRISGLNTSWHISQYIAVSWHISQYIAVCWQISKFSSLTACGWIAISWLWSVLEGLNHLLQINCSVTTHIRDILPRVEMRLVHICYIKVTFEMG